MSEIDRLIDLLAKLPGLGPRSARRAALHLLKRREALMRAAGQRARRDGDSASAPARPAAISTPPIPARSAAIRGAMPSCSASSRKSPISGRSSAPAPSRAAITCWAARCRRSTASGPSDLRIDRLLARVAEGGVARGDPRLERHRRGPDHGALHHGPARRLWRRRSRASPTACRSAANSIISTRARSPPRSPRAGRSRGRGNPYSAMRRGFLGSSTSSASPSMSWSLSCTVKEESAAGSARFCGTPSFARPRARQQALAHRSGKLLIAVGRALDALADAYPSMLAEQLSALSPMVK